MRDWAFVALFCAGALALGGARLCNDFFFDQRNNSFLAELAAAPLVEIAADRGTVGPEKILNDFLARTDSPSAKAVVAYSGPPPIDVFVSPAAVTDVTLSPNGRFVAAVREIGGSEHAVVYDLSGEIPAGAVNFKDFNIDWIAWASDDRLLVGYSLYATVFVIGPNFAFVIGGSRVLAINRDGTNPVNLFKGQPTVAANNFDLSIVTHMLPDDPAHILMSAFEGERLGVWKVNVDTGDATIVERGSLNTGAWFADKDGRPIIRIDTNKKADFLRLFTKDPKDGDWRQISSGPFTAHRTPNVWPAAAANEANAVYVLANTETEDRVSMKIFDTTTGAFLRTAYSHPKVDVGGAMVDAATSSYLGSWYFEDEYRVKFDDPLLQKHYDGLRAFFDNNANVLIQDTSGGGSRFLVFVSGPRDPGDYYIYDYAKAAITPLFSAYPRLPVEALSNMEAIRYQTRDGLKQTAYLTHPNGIGSAPAPLIVMPHGGPEARDYFGFDPYAQFFASRGYRVLQPNFRGSAGYGKAFAESGYGQWGRKMQDDIDDAVAHVSAQGLVKKGEICIFGASYGGYAALVAAMNAPETYRCAASLAGVSDLLRFLEHEREQEGADSDSYQYWARVIGNPRTDREALRANSPLFNASRIAIPVFLAHGASDSTVPVEQSRLMRDALTALGRPPTYLELEKTGHSNWPTEKEVEFLTVLEQFLARNIRPANVAEVAGEEPVLVSYSP